MKLIALMKKEFLRFFGDPKLIVTMLLPGILIYLIYSLMGTAIFGGEEVYDFKVYVSEHSAAETVIAQTVEANEGWSIEFLELGELTPEEASAEVQEGNADAVIVYPENFDEGIASGGGFDSSLDLIYNSAETQSLRVYTILNAVFASWARPFVLTASDMGESDAFGMQMMSGFLPFLIVVFIFSSCMSVTLESVAGEKERGTLATILVTSARRSDIALGKILPLACVSLIGAASSFLGVALSLPTLMGVSIDVAIAGVGALEFFFIFLLIVSVVPLIVAAIAAVSTLSRSVKEASSYTSVLMILVMVLSIVASFVSGIGDWVVVIPVLNAVVAMQGALMGAASVWMCLTAVALNLVYTVLLVLLISRFLSSERIMFGT